MTAQQLLSALRPDTLDQIAADLAHPHGATRGEPPRRLSVIRRHIDAAAKGEPAALAALDRLLPPPKGVTP